MATEQDNVVSGKVLLFGAGRVASPCVGYLIKKHYHVTVGSIVQSELDQIKAAHPKVETCIVDVTNRAEIEHAVQHQHVVIGLVPGSLLPLVAEVCVDLGKHFVSSSYVCEGMAKLHDKAVSAGVTLLNEMGLDPGLDHAIAMSCIDAIKEKQGTVTSFFSACGGLPRPEDSHCPLRYKISWYPKGVLISSMAPAKYLKDEKIVAIPGGHIFDNVIPLHGLVEGEVLECVPNRMSLGYTDLYDIPSSHSIYRGTLRYQGFSKSMRLLIQLGLLSSEKRHEGWQPTSWRSCLCNALSLPQTADQDTIRQSLLDKADGDLTAVDNVFGLGVCDDQPMPGLATPRDDLASLLSSKLNYGPEEKDLVAMRTVVEAEYPDGKKERRTVDLVLTGLEETAMSTTVGVPSAVGAHLLAQGAVKQTGVICPTSAAIYTPLLDVLAEEGIVLKYYTQEKR